MTVDPKDLKAAGEIADRLAAARGAVKTAKRNIELLRDFQAERKDWAVNASWKPELILKKGNGYGRDVAVRVEIPFGVVQQQLAYELASAKRCVVELENEAARIAKRMAASCGPKHFEPTHAVETAAE